MNTLTKVATKKENVIVKKNVKIAKIVVNRPNNDKHIEIDYPKQIAEILSIGNVNNTYKYASAEIKRDCSDLIQDAIKVMFPKLKKLNIVTLGGEKLAFENKLINSYQLNGVSYEKESKSVDIAKSNAPKGIKVICDDILHHVYNGTENCFWFDFMCCLRPENVAELVNWIIKNPIKNECVFAVTYTLHSRKKGEGYRQLFGTEDNHNDFINRMKDYIGFYLESEYVRVESKVNVTRYCNTKKAKPMVQYIFNLKAK